MSAIIKVDFNEICSTYEAAHDGAEPGKFIENFGDSMVEGSDRAKEPKFRPLYTGSPDASETVAADDVESAIAAVCKSKIGSRWYSNALDEEGRDIHDKWLCHVVRAIQIVRCEPTAFTTI